jgi:hypothetical protein
MNVIDGVLERGWAARQRGSGAVSDIYVGVLLLPLRLAAPLTRPQIQLRLFLYQLIQRERH